jgi:hypothetical protein
MDREEVQGGILKALAVVGASGAALSWWAMANSALPPSQFIWLSIFATLVTVFCLALAEVALGPAKMLLLASWSFIVALCCLMDVPGHEVLVVLLALAAGALLRPWLALVAGAGGAIWLLAVRQGQEPAAPAAVALTSTCIWLVLRPLYDLLERYSRQSMQAVALAEELKEQRGKLNRTIKDLSLSY